MTSTKTWTWSPSFETWVSISDSAPCSLATQSNRGSMTPMAKREWVSQSLATSCSKATISWDWGNSIIVVSNLVGVTNGGTSQAAVNWSDACLEGVMRGSVPRFLYLWTLKGTSWVSQRETLYGLIKRRRHLTTCINTFSIFPMQILKAAFSKSHFCLLRKFKKYWLVISRDRRIAMGRRHWLGRLWRWLMANRHWRM